MKFYDDIYIGGNLRINQVNNAVSSQLTALFYNDNGEITKRVVGDIINSSTQDFIKEITFSFPNIFSLNRSVINGVNNSLTATLVTQTKGTVFAANGAFNSQPSFIKLTSEHLSDANVMFNTHVANTITDSDIARWNNAANPSESFLPLTGGTLTGNLTLNASTVDYASLNIPSGVAPNTPLPGDIWYTASGLTIRIGSTTRVLAHTSQWSEITEAAILSGTESTARFISARRLQYAFDNIPAANAIKLYTPRKINGVSFDGTADITITAAPTAHTHAISDVTALQTTLDGKQAKHVNLDKVSGISTTSVGYIKKDASNNWSVVNDLYSAGNGLTLTGTVFSLSVTSDGSGEIVSAVAQTTSGISVSKVSLTSLLTGAISSVLTTNLSTSVFVSTDSNGKLASTTIPLSSITTTKISNWDNAATNSHTHSNKDKLDLINQTLSTTASPTFNRLNLTSSAGSWISGHLSSPINFTAASSATSYFPWMNQSFSDGSNVSVGTLGTNLYFSFATSDNMSTSTNNSTKIVTVNTSGITIVGKIIKSGGTSAQFLKADGSLDENTYITENTARAALVTSTSATGVSNVATTNTNTYLNITQNGASPGSSTQVTGAGSVTVSSDTAGKLTITGTDTTYSTGTNALLTAGTDTTVRVWSANVLKTQLDNYFLTAGGAINGKTTIKTSNTTAGWQNNTVNDANNYIQNNILALTTNNQGLHFFGDYTMNARRMGIQSSHASTGYANTPGILELNPFGGIVRIGSGGLNINGSLNFNNGLSIESQMADGSIKHFKNNATNLYNNSVAGTYASYQTFTSSATAFSGTTLTLTHKSGTTLTVSSSGTSTAINKIFSISGYVKINNVPPTADVWTATPITSQGGGSSIKNYYDEATGYFECVHQYKSATGWLIHKAIATLVVNDVITLTNLTFVEDITPLDWKLGLLDLKYLIDGNYSAGNGLTLSGTTFSLPVTQSGSGNAVTAVTQSTNGITVTKTDTFLKKIEPSVGLLAVAYSNASLASTQKSKLRITLPFKTNAGVMLGFTIRIYGTYRFMDIQCAGYLYSSPNNWLYPNAKVSHDGGNNNSTNFDVVFGRDDDGYAYVTIPNFDYIGVAVLNAVRGYSNTGTASPILPTLDWTITQNEDTPNIASTVNTGIRESIPIATTTLKGLIKVGANLSITADGTLSSTYTNTTYTAGNGLTLSGTAFSLPITDSGSGNYVSNVVASTNGLTVTKATLPTPALVTSTSATGVSNVVTTNTNTFLNVTQNGASPGSSTQVTGAGSVTVSSDANGKLTITGTDTNTTYTAGNGLTLSGTAFSLPVTDSGSGNYVSNVVASSTGLTVTKATLPTPALVTSTSATGVSNVATTNTNTYLNVTQGGASPGSSTQITGAGSVTVTSDANGKLTITGTNTTYSEGSLALLTAGTDTTSRVWKVSDLVNYFNSRIATQYFSKKYSTFNSYICYVVPLFEYTTDTNQGNNYFYGEVIFNRSNGNQLFRDIVKVYGGSAYNLQPSVVFDSSNSTLALVSFTYNTKKYIGIRSTSAATHGELFIKAISSDFTLHTPVSYYNSDTLAVINAEINSSIQDFVVVQKTIKKNYDIETIGTVKSDSFIKINGTSAQFLKADGSVDATTYTTDAKAKAALVTSTSATGVSNVATTNTNTYLNITQNGASPGSSTQVTGAGSVTVSSDTAGKLTITGTDTNTTYSAGNGLTLSGTAFSLPVTQSGSGNAVTAITQDTNGITVTKGSTFSIDGHVHTFASLTSKPTTLSGYGITDAGISGAVTNTATSTTDVASTSNGSTFINRMQGGVIKESVKFVGAGSVSITHATGGIITVTGTNTTYSAGNGLTLSGTAFSLPVTDSGSGNYVSNVVASSTGLTVTKATLPTPALVTSTSATGVSNAATTNTNTFLNVTQGGASPGSSTQITGAGSVTVTSDTAGKLTITGTNTTYSAGTLANINEANTTSMIWSGSVLKSKFDTYLLSTANAVSATKLNTSRTIDVGVALESTPTSFDGTSNIVIPVDSVKEAYISWGGRNRTGSYGPVDAAINGDLHANRFAFPKASAVDIEYSRDSGATWTDYEASDTSKINIFSGISQSFTIGKNSTAQTNTTNYQLKITYKASAPLYTELNKIMLLLATNGSDGSWCSVDARLQTNVTSGTNTWANLINKASLSGWSGWNVLNLSVVIGTNAGQYGEIRFTFGCTSHSSLAYTGLTIQKIVGYGGVGWTTPSALARIGSLYSWDASQNANFPANITSESFIKSGGTSAQFLKADGSVDATAYTTDAKAKAALVTSTSATGVSNVATTNTNTYLNVTQNGASPGSSTQVTGAGSVTVSSDTAGKLTITGTNTTYSAGNGLTLSGTAFSLPVTDSGSGNYVSNVVASSTGLTITKATLPTPALVTSTSATGVSNVATTNTNTYLNVTQNGASPGSSTQVTGAGSVTVTSDANGKLTITGTDTNTTYSAGNGLTLSGTAFSLPVTDSGSGNTVSNVVASSTGLTITKTNAPLSAVTSTYVSNTVRILDNRDVELVPNTNLARGIQFDFKSTTGLSLTGAGTYASVITMVPYGDNTGNTNTAFQLAQSSNNLYFRNWGTSWGSWDRLVKASEMSGYTTTTQARAALVTSTSATGVSNVATTNTNTYLNITQNGASPGSSTQVTGAGSVTVTSDANGKLTITGTNTNTTYTAGNGLTLSGTAFSLPVTDSGSGNYVSNVVASSTGLTVTKATLPTPALVTSTSATGVSNVATTNTNTYLNVTQGGASPGTSTQITGAGSVTVTSDTAGKLTITGVDTNTTYEAGTETDLSGSTDNGNSKVWAAKILTSHFYTLNGGTLYGAVYAPAFYETSLRKYKTNIKDFTLSGIELVNSLDIVTFDRIESETQSKIKHKIGVIADDTRDEFLSENKDAVDLYKTTFIQAKAIQELTKKNEVLENELKEIKEMLQKLLK